MLKQNNHNHNHDYNLMGFDPIEINLVRLIIINLNYPDLGEIHASPRRKGLH